MFLAALRPQLEQHGKNEGDGLRLLTGRITSPTLLHQIDAFLSRYPRAIWHVHEPIDEEAAHEGAKLAFGRPLQMLPRFAQAEVVLALDADPIGPSPSQIRNARHWIEARNARKPDTYSRFYVAEAALTLSGVKADHRLAAHPGVISDIAITVANTLGAGLPQPALPAEAARFADACARDLNAHKGRALVLPGRTQTREVHALAHWIDAQLNVPVDLIEPFDRPAGREPQGLSTLAQDLDAGRVQTIVIMDSNPAYDAPADLLIAEALNKAPFSVHLGSHRDETAVLCRWHLPQSHSLESWSDLRAVDGTAAIVQPLIRPLYASRTAHELMAILVGQNDATAYDLVRDTWRATGGSAFDDWWRQTLHDGVVAGTTSKPVAVEAPRLPEIKPSGDRSGFSLVLSPDPSAWDGRFANNPWLQECPKPTSKEVWGNALSIGTEDARKLGLVTGDVVRIAVNDRLVQTPILVAPGCAPGVVNLTLGYGRRDAGKIGNGVGVDAYRLRTSDAPWVIASVTISRTGEHQEVLTTQNYVRLEGDVRDLYPMLSLSELASGAKASKEELRACPRSIRLLNTTPMLGHGDRHGGLHRLQRLRRRLPGREQRAGRRPRGDCARPRHALAARRYLRPRHDRARRMPGFQPVPCMHCEHAPCEPVCPVAASVHDSEGLNVQVYNRCVGTRFCEANCPYKVRRFNFFGYADGQEYANLGAETIRAQHNPDVSTRQRGVMEKCTYCVQRISRARRTAKKEDRTIADGEVVTACQSRLSDPGHYLRRPQRAGSRRSRHLKSDPRNYALLGHLDTRPRTTYLADLRNPNPALKGERP